MLKPPKTLTKAQAKKRIRGMLRPTFDIICYYFGFDPTLDLEITKLAKVRKGGSGYYFSTGHRDINFRFDSEARARAAAERIKEALPNVYVMLNSFKEL